jgi:hypothetical protein
MSDEISSTKTGVAILVAVIGCVGAIIGGILAGPLAERLIKSPDSPTPVLPTSFPTELPTMTLPLPSESTRIPTTTPTSEGGSTISWQLCSPLGLESCQCEWRLTIEASTSDAQVDSWYLRNTGAGTLEIYSVRSSCESCLNVLIGYGSENTRDNTTVHIPAQSDGGITIWYYPDEDPERGTDHDYELVIYSDAENCPGLSIPVAIRYK